MNCNFCDSPDPEFYPTLKTKCKACVREQQRAYKRNNREKVNAKQRLYKKKNRAIFTAAQGRRRAALLQRTPSWADQAEIRKHYDFADRFRESFGLDLHVDHIVPLQGEKVSGLHVHNNLQVILASENLSKKHSYEVV